MTRNPMFPARAGAFAGALAAFLLSFALGATPAFAADAPAGSPEAMVDSVSTDTIEAIRHDKAIQSGDFDRLQKLVNERVLPHIDFDRMTRLAVGRAWRGATAEQRKSLTDEFRILLLHTYSNALARVSDHKVRLRPSRPQATPGESIVRTQVVPSQGDPIDLDYRLELVEGQWKVYDINILGVWLVEAYKNEFSEAVSKGGVDALVTSLIEKNRHFSAGTK
jgi:phospholipid transport system substrate-binding protein